MNDNNKDRKPNPISRRSFLKRSLAAGFFLNLNVHPFTCYPVRMLSNTGKQAGSIDTKYGYWHGKVRKLRYHPDGGDFVITNGRHRFNRALYGTHTAFRVEAGDLPEFALFMPGMGGTMRPGLMRNHSSKWLIDAEKIVARYRPGTMMYEVHDPLLGGGSLHLKLLAMSDAEGMLVRIHFENIPDDDVRMLWAYGGASDDHFSRNGDIGADPVSGFFLLPEHCRNNEYKMEDHAFELRYGKNGGKRLSGIFAPDARLHFADAGSQATPEEFILSTGSETPAVAAVIPARTGQPLFTCIYNPDTRDAVDYASVPELFDQSEKARMELTGRVRLSTPDPFINPFGGALSVAADAIWEPPSYLHGAIAWRARLNGWRGAYVADPLGWHERARMHFTSYGKSQLISPASGPVVPDPAEHLAREKMEIGTAVYTSGYICPKPGGHFSADHYDMNLDTIDELLRHFQWTGDWSYIREMWPVLKRHLAWEKRCFDGNNDGLYDAYACIWASDALQYSGGGVTHSSAFNYRANKWAAYIAEHIGEDADSYHTEAQKILQAIQEKLWLPEAGRYAEYRDFSGRKDIHPCPGLWTVYHTIDSEVPDPFMAYQLLRYVDTEIPHIPVKAEGLSEEGGHTLSTTNWMPYTWSVNNVAMAGVLHTSLAYWQAGRMEEAFRLWKSTILDNMYLGISPGNFEQLSFYDAMRGELYRDFADPIGVAARTLVEGLFGIVPDAMSGELLIRPGLSKEWNHASLDVPDISFRFTRTGQNDRYLIKPHFPRKMKLHFKIPARGTKAERVKINGQNVPWKNVDQAVGRPLLEIFARPQTEYEIEIAWSGDPPEAVKSPEITALGDLLRMEAGRAVFLKIHDPQKILSGERLEDKNENSSHRLSGRIVGKAGHRTFFVKIRQNEFIWWHPVCLEVRNPVEVLPSKTQDRNELHFRIRNNAASQISGEISVSNGRSKFSRQIRSKSQSESAEFIADRGILPGTNFVTITTQNGKGFGGSVINWDLKCPPEVRLDTVDISGHFNDKVTSIFQNKYLTPRPPYPTLQLPTQGIGNWCSPLAQADIDDSGLRKLAGPANQFVLPQGIPFRTPGSQNAKNIIFTSRWDNYPEEVSVPLSGSASHAYFLMAGSTNPMQSRFVNGRISIEYQGGSRIQLELRNPETWWPIEQDYYIDEYAFSLNAPKPVRVHLKTGFITRDFRDYTSIKGLTDYAIEGGAATVWDLPLNPEKKLKKLQLEATANDVVIGLMSLTLAV